MRVWEGFLPLIIAMAMVMAFPTLISANPKERIDYWRKNYGELRPQDDPRAARAHAIFSRVLQAAGKRAGVVPRLFITRTNPLDLSLPVAIPDGSVILSPRVLELCYQEQKHGDDRLAFVVAHEIAHQLKDDFWHMRFFQAIEASKEKAPQSKALLEEVRNIAGSTDKVLAQELQADERGIIYMSMAGFDPTAIVTKDTTVNFFADWVRALDPSPVFAQKPSHPTTLQRAVAVKASLRQILDQVAVFQVGLWFYQAGDYERAILAFQDFLRIFPSREVYHNLAVSHHQLAVQSYHRWKGEMFPFKLSLAIDPTTRARGIFRGNQTPDVLFPEHLNQAVEFYQAAIAHDPSYLLSYTNLGAALILKEDVYKAIATLQDALKIDPQSTEALNNLGVAFFFAENPRKARIQLLQAHELNPLYDAPLFNLGKLAYDEKREEEARRYWLAYLKQDPASPWAQTIQKFLGQTSLPPATLPPTETILGLTVGTFEDKVPRNWGPLSAVPQYIPLEEEPFKVTTYNNGVVTISQDEQIQLIVVLEWYKGKSSRGLMIGSGEQDLLTTYGIPARILPMTQGVSWVYTYDTYGIAFQLRQGKIISWLLF
jgi:tetratricopeptide (TPR) repeat protein